MSATYFLEEKLEVFWPGTDLEGTSRAVSEGWAL